MLQASFALRSFFNAKTSMIMLKYENNFTTKETIFMPQLQHLDTLITSRALCFVSHHMYLLCRLLPSFFSLQSYPNMPSREISRKTAQLIILSAHLKELDGIYILMKIQNSNDYPGSLS